MKDLNEPSQSLAGAILLSSPSLTESSFNKTVILLSAHTNEVGAMGVVLNRPLDKTLSDINIDFSSGPLGQVPIHSGGPVSSEELILVAWQLQENAKGMKLYFGISPEQASDLLLLKNGVQVYAFMGYSGWTKGQLEEEIKEQAWLVSPFPVNEFKPELKEDMWKNALIRLNPNFEIITEMPDDPSVN